VLIPGRDYDQWCIGWAGTHIYSDLRADGALFGEDLDKLEQAVEVFYNFRLSSAIGLTINAQFIDSTLAAVDEAYTLGTRLQIDL
jgi:hypothetical protein